MVLSKEQVQEMLSDVIGPALAKALDEKGVSDVMLSCVSNELQPHGERVSISKNHMAVLLISTLAARFLSKIIMNQPTVNMTRGDVC